MQYLERFFWTRLSWIQLLCYRWIVYSWQRSTPLLPALDVRRQPAHSAQKRVWPPLTRPTPTQPLEHLRCETLNAEILLRVQRQVKALKLRELALPTKTTKQQARQSRYRKPSARDGMRSETIASPRMLGLSTCVTSEELERQVRDEWREAQANPAQLARLLNPTPTRVPGNARRGTHRWSAASPIFGVWAFNVSASKVSLGFLTLWIWQGWVRHLRRTSSQWRNSGHLRRWPWRGRRRFRHWTWASPRRRWKGTPKETFIRCQRGHQEGLRRTSQGNPCGPRPGTIVTKKRKQLHEEVGKYCEQAGAIKMNSIYKANLLLRSSIFLKDLASADAHHIHLGHLQEGLPWECSRWSGTFANQLLRVHYRRRCFAWKRRILCWGTSAAISSRSRGAIRSVATCRSGWWSTRSSETWRPFACCALRLVVVRYWCQPALNWQGVKSRKCFSTSSWSRVMPKRWWSLTAAKNTWAHPAASPAEDNASDVDWSSGVLPKKRRVDAPVSQASPGLLESPANVSQRSRRGHLGRRWPANDGFNNNHSRSKQLAFDPYQTERWLILGHHHQPQRFFETFLGSVSLAGVSLIRAGGASVSSAASPEILKRRIATSAATRRNASFTSTSLASFFVGGATFTAWIISGKALTSDKHHDAGQIDQT